MTLKKCSVAVSHPHIIGSAVSLFVVTLGGIWRFLAWYYKGHYGGQIETYKARLAMKDDAASLAQKRFDETSDNLPKSDTCGIKIIFPPEGTKQEKVVDVRGAIAKRLPPGYRLIIMRQYREKVHSYVPTSEATVDADAGRWHANGCNIGGKAGDRRPIAAFIIGPNAQALIEYFHDAEEVYERTLNELGATNNPNVSRYLPMIT
jgi:hypothetical protein